MTDKNIRYLFNYSKPRVQKSLLLSGNWVCIYMCVHVCMCYE